MLFVAFVEGSLLSLTPLTPLPPLTPLAPLAWLEVQDPTPWRPLSNRPRRVMVSAAMMAESRALMGPKKGTEDMVGGIVNADLVPSTNAHLAQPPRNHGTWNYVNIDRARAVHTMS
jgi:hypothetical protein